MSPGDVQICEIRKQESKVQCSQRLERFLKKTFFDPDSITVEPITEDADYEGVRVRFRGHLDAARLTIQLDIGFGDKVYPAPVQESLPSLLNFPPVEMYCYSRESMIAEK